METPRRSHRDPSCTVVSRLKDCLGRPPISQDSTASPQAYWPRKLRESQISVSSCEADYIEDCIVLLGYGRGRWFEDMPKKCFSLFLWAGPMAPRLCAVGMAFSNVVEAAVGIDAPEKQISTGSCSARAANEWPTPLSSVPEAHLLFFVMPN